MYNWRINNTLNDDYKRRVIRPTFRDQFMIITNDCMIFCLDTYTRKRIQIQYENKNVVENIAFMITWTLKKNLNLINFMAKKWSDHSYHLPCIQIYKLYNNNLFKWINGYCPIVQVLGKILNNKLIKVANLVKMVRIYKPNRLTWIK